MQVASRHCTWIPDEPGTAVEISLDSFTGLYIRFCLGLFEGKDAFVSWGDGCCEDIASGSLEADVEHTYAKEGAYKVVFRRIRHVGLRRSYGNKYQYDYDVAILSVVDSSGLVAEIPSGAFKRATNLKEFIAPNVRSVGQQPFAYCRNLEHVRLGSVGIFYDGAFQYCSSLVRYEATGTGTAYRYVWQGCSKLQELSLGNVDAIGVAAFSATPLLKDIYISGKTAAQICGADREGMIRNATWGESFPWGANSSCRFHGTDGVVMSDGTIIA